MMARTSISIATLSGTARWPALSLGLSLLCVSSLGCQRQDTQAEPDPAQVSVQVEAQAKPGIRKPLALPQGETVEVEGHPEEPEAAPQVAPKAPADNQAPGVDSDTKTADVAPSGVASQLTIKRLVVTTGIEQREPVSVSHFAAGADVVYAFVELENAGEAEQDIVITFERLGGRKVGHVELNVPANQPRWRTWGRTQNIKQAGQWDAVVRDMAGNELARTRFEVS